MTKSFDDLTIADDFMFCKIMQDEAICKQFLEMVLVNEIGKDKPLVTASDYPEDRIREY